MNKFNTWITKKVLPEIAREAFAIDMKYKDREILHYKREYDKIYQELQHTEQALRESQAECRGLKYAARQKIVIENK